MRLRNQFFNTTLLVSGHLRKDKNYFVLHKARDAHLGLSKYPVNLILCQCNPTDVIAEFQHYINIYNKIKRFQTTLANQFQASLNPDFDTRLSSRIQTTPEEVTHSRSFAGHLCETRKIGQTDGPAQLPAIVGKLEAIDRAC